MPTDEEQIRRLVATWMAATKAGDIETVLDLMTDDVVFLVAGRPPMDKKEFAANAKPKAGQPVPRFEGSSEIQEITVSGDWAFMWAKLSVTVFPPDGGQTVQRAGHTLTVFHKVNDKWLLARDANLLAPGPDRPAR